MTELHDILTLDIDDLENRAKSQAGGSKALPLVTSEEILTLITMVRRLVDALSTRGQQHEFEQVY